jgi:hypothetical protein
MYDLALIFKIFSFLLFVPWDFLQIFFVCMHDKLYCVKFFLWDKTISALGLCLR